MKELTLKIILKDYTDTRANHTMLDLKEITKCQITSQMSDNIPNDGQRLLLVHRCLAHTVFFNN